MFLLSIKNLSKSSPFRKTERGKFEAKILPKEKLGLPTRKALPSKAAPLLFCHGSVAVLPYELFNVVLDCLTPEVVTLGA